jgi:GNAT superfamily N-acetyltransferase
MNSFTIIGVTAENVADAGICCNKDKKSPGFKAKVEWFKLKINQGLKIQLVLDERGKQIGFIEYIPGEMAWRPVNAAGYLFIHCIVVYEKDSRNKNIATRLLQECENDAKLDHKSGICAMTSDGVWMANKTIFEKNGLEVADKLGRFELMVKKFDDKNPVPRFIDWTKNLAKYKGWNLIYSDQCPWHEKSVSDLKLTAKNHGIELIVTKLTTPEEAQQAPSGFGTFGLIYDGKLLEDHYLSKTRFENILKQQNAK